MSEAKRKATRYFHEGIGRWIRCWYEPANRQTYHQLASRWLYERKHGPIPEGYVIHHRDGDPGNDSLDNLQLLSDREHRALHARLRGSYKIIEGVEHKRCPECGNYEPPDCFYMRSDGRFSAYCTACERKRSQEWRTTHKEYSAAYKRTQRAENGEHINALQRARYAENREHVNTLRRARYAENRERVNALQRIRYAENREHINTRRRIRHAEKRTIREGNT